MFRLPIARSAALVSATVATRGITQQQGDRPQSDQKSDSESKLRDKENVVQDKEKPMKDVNQKDQQENQGPSKTSGKGRN
jgi:hypothetical protein